MMATAAASPILQVIRRVVEDPQVRELPDRELLQRFHSQHDEAAFHTLLRRHGPMVLDVCRGVLGDGPDAEDVFQATFLVLAQKAGSIRKTASLGSWLHGVALRTALKARARSAVRQKQKARAPERQVSEADDLSWREVRQVLHEELGGMSERYREALVMCYLEGATQHRAAARLGLAERTLRERLERGRELLRVRLVRRGLGPATILAVAAWPTATVAAAVPAVLVDSTVKAATSVAAGQAAAAGVVSARVAALTQGALKTMSLTKLKTVTAVLLVLGMVAFGGGLIHQVLGARQSAAQSDDTAKKQPKQTDDQKDLKRDPAVKDQRAGEAKAILERALQVADEVPDGREKAELLRAAAVSRLKAGDRKGHDELLAKALLVVDALPEDRKGNNAQEDLRDVYKAFFLKELTGLQAQAGDPDLARRTAGAIPIPRDYGDELYFKAQALGAVATEQARAGDIQGARKTLDQIEENEIYEGGMRSAKVFPLFCIATAQAKTGDVQGALATAEDIGPLMLRVWALSRIAEAQAMAKDKKGSIRTLERALELARKAPLRPGEWDEKDGSIPNAFGYIIDARALTGDVEGARKLAEELMEQVKEFRPPGQKQEIQLFYAFLLLGQRQAAAGDVESARKTADTLLPKGSREQGEVLLAIVKAQLAAGNAKGAVDTAAAIAHWEERALALVAIGRAHASQGQSAEAAKALRDARSLIGEHKLVPVQERRSRIEIDLPVAWMETGDLPGTIRLINEIPSPRVRFYALLAVGEALEAQTKEKVPQKK